MEIKCQHCGQWFEWPVEVEPGDVVVSTGTMCKRCGRVTKLDLVGNE